MTEELKQRLDTFTDELFELCANEDLTEEVLREASEDLLPSLYDALHDAGFGKQMSEDTAV